MNRAAATSILLAPLARPLKQPRTLRIRYIDTLYSYRVVSSIPRVAPQVADPNRHSVSPDHRGSKASKVESSRTASVSYCLLHSPVARRRTVIFEIATAERSMRDKETKGAWIIHHGRKLAFDINGAAEFCAIDEAAKAATLLTKLGQEQTDRVSMSEVSAIARASGLNPRHELNGLLDTLSRKRLVEKVGDEIVVLGVTPTGALGHAVDVFSDAQPSAYEHASLNLAEMASQSPIRRSQIAERIGDEHRLTRIDVDGFLDRAEAIGFVDKEIDGDDHLLFNGNLFRRDSVLKSQKVLSSLSEIEQSLVMEVAERLRDSGCLMFTEVEQMLSVELLEKLVAAGVYDLNTVANETGHHVYITSPSAFHKFVDPLVDDCFDMAKSLVAALTFGMTRRSPTHGRIRLLPILLARLVAGGEVGPATAIGNDYRALEASRVVKLRPSATEQNRFYMKLLKKRVGELALEVLTAGDADSAAISFPSAPMERYIGPEESRVAVRRKQSSVSKRTTLDILEAARGGPLE